MAQRMFSKLFVLQMHRQEIHTNVLLHSNTRVFAHFAVTSSLIPLGFCTVSLTVARSPPGDGAALHP